MEYLSMDEIHSEELSLFKKVLEFLKKYDIKYYIFYGTLLGSVRNKKYIPWDDDMDILIPRIEYNRLCKVLRDSKEMDAIGYELGNSDWPYVKFINRSRPIIASNGCDKYLWIDVYPLDGVKNKYHFKHYYIRFLEYLINVKKDYVRGLKSNILGKLTKFIDYSKLLNYFIRVCSKYRNSKYLTVSVIEEKKRKIFHESWFKEIDMEFEGMSVKGPSGYNEILSVLYGKDYIKLPPVSERGGHSFKALR